MDDLGFAFRARRDGRVAISHRGRDVVTLAGERAAAFLRRAEGADPDALQQLMARATGNFRRGNERLARQRSRRA